MWADGLVELTDKMMACGTAATMVSQMAYEVVLMRGRTRVARTVTSRAASMAKQMAAW